MRILWFHRYNFIFVDSIEQRRAAQAKQTCGLCLVPARHFECLPNQVYLNRVQVDTLRGQHENTGDLAAYVVQLVGQMAGLHRATSSEINRLLGDSLEFSDVPGQS